jgi:hypothetical protein
MDGGGERLSVDGNCGRPPADGAAVRLRRTALEDGPGRRRTSVGSSDASGRPPDAAVDVRTRDNPGINPLLCIYPPPLKHSSYTFTHQLPTLLLPLVIPNFIICSHPKHPHITTFSMRPSFTIPDTLLCRFSRFLSSTRHLLNHLPSPLTLAHVLKPTLFLNPASQAHSSLLHTTLWLMTPAHLLPPLLHLHTQLKTAPLHIPPPTFNLDHLLLSAPRLTNPILPTSFQTYSSIQSFSTIYSLPYPHTPTH